MTLSPRPSAINPYQPYRLELVEEKPSSLTFRQGDLGRRAALRKAWLDLVEAMVFCLIPVALFFSPFPQLARERWAISVPGAPAATHWVGWMVVLIPIVYTALIKPCFVVWTFDRQRQRIVRAVTNGIGVELQTFFEFREILSVDVLQRHVPDGRENSYCWLILDSGHRVLLSACKTDADKRSKAIILKHHLLVSEQVRDLMQMYTPPAIRSERLHIPPAPLPVDAPTPAFSWRSLWANLGVSKKQRQARITQMRRQVAADPSSGQAWEDLAFALSLESSQRHEVIEAYRKAESLYRSHGNQKKADFVARILRQLNREEAHF
jgi:hypothetical protein